jgi:hypothetical protein
MAFAAVHGFGRHLLVKCTDEVQARRAPLSDFANPDPTQAETPAARGPQNTRCRRGAEGCDDQYREAKAEASRAGTPFRCVDRFRGRLPDAGLLRAQA